MDELPHQLVANRIPFELSPRSLYFTAMNFLILGLLQAVSVPIYYQ